MCPSGAIRCDGADQVVPQRPLPCAAEPEASPAHSLFVLQKVCPINCFECLAPITDATFGRVVCEADEGGEPEQVGVLCAACVADEAAHARHEHECDLAAAKAQTEAYAELYFADFAPAPRKRLAWAFAGRNADLRAHLGAN
jgi:hypothetical protein